MPDHLNSQPFQSKEFPAEATWVGDALRRELSAFSDAGNLSFVIDVSTCAKHLREFLSDALVFDSIQFLLSQVLPRLTITQKLPIVAVHRNCSA
ncbi:MAG: hypothetical protein MO846_04035 [Candidatus Devosia symbiotica]|nr:hypothetical protein [Candidatus Devosia symbiotica]